MKVKPVVVIVPIIFIFVSTANAQWLCREASSTRRGQVITACGVGQSRNLGEARIKSRESAIEEFKRLCQLSSDCTAFDYTVVPKRTECEFKNGNHICFRALDFEISDLKRKSVSLDIEELEREFIHSSKEIQNIQERIEKINQIKKSEQESIAKKNELAELEESLNQKEAKALKLQDLNSSETIKSGGFRYLHQVYRNSFKFSFHFWDSKFTANSENDIMWIAAYEKRPFSWFGVQFYGGFGRGRLSNQKNSDEDVPTMGTSNSTQNFNGPVMYSDIGAALVIYSGWRGTYFKLDFGFVNGRKEYFDVTYNNSGVGVPTKTTNTFSSNYYGGHLGFDTRDDKKGWGIFFELGARKHRDQNSPGFMGGLGINYGF
ncbi:MAG: hypothetical protein J0M15_14980 [Deltaproteobacteria bacterium]|jgi:hypothetical protein|nr:hypothetical protein [Deltaproteobacteria bacterium]